MTYKEVAAFFIYDYTGWLVAQGMKYLPPNRPDLKEIVIDHAFDDAVEFLKSKSIDISPEEALDYPNKYPQWFAAASKYDA